MIRLANGDSISVKKAEIGMVAAEGGEITSVVPFVTAHNACILNDEWIELHPTGDQTVAVYLENLHDVSSYSAYFIFRGNTIEELREELIDRLGWNSEHVPTIVFYTSRSGMVRHISKPILSKHVDSVYVFMK